MNITLLDASSANLTETLSNSFLQTDYWAEFKSLYGWKYLRFYCTSEADCQQFPPFILTVLFRSISGFGTLCYIPGGPDVECVDQAVQVHLLETISNQLRPYLPRDAICIRYDTLWSSSEKITDTEDAASTTFNRLVLKSTFLRKAESDIQPPDTVILDLTFPEDQLLANMKSKCRYNCKLGQKKGLIIRRIDKPEDQSSSLNVFYSLYQETAKRDGIAIHSKDYYQDLFSIVNSRSISAPEMRASIRLYIAEHESMPLAAIIVLYSNNEAVYLYGASSNNKRNLMPAYALQWQAIRDARLAGCKKYDLYGIPPTNDPSHPMHGLYRFKTGFGGMILHRPGSYDYPLNAARYSIFSFAQKIRTQWYKKIVKCIKRGIPRSS